jgi:hypothetical protein
VTFVSASAIRDLRDYFVVWPERGMVRLLYRADHREAANYLDAHPEIDDIAIGSALMGPWDRIALQVDTEREDVAPRLFNPERALVWAAGDGASPAAAVLIPSWPDPASPIEDLLGKGTAEGSELGSGAAEAPHLALYMVPPISQVLTVPQSAISRTQFANGLVLTGAHWLDLDSLAPGREAILLTTWHVAAPLDLPPIAVVAQPPPPKTYSGPRLAVFAHLSDVGGRMLASDDGLWVDPLTLQPGDRFVQVHRFPVPDGASAGPYALGLGLYDPKTNERWSVLRNAQYHDGRDDAAGLVEVLNQCDAVFFCAEARRDPAPAGSVIELQDGRPVPLEHLMSVRRSREDS